MHRKKHRVRQNEDTEEYIPKEQDKASEKDLKEMEISNLTDRVQSNTHKVLTKLGRRINEDRENFNKEIENTRNYQSELKNTICEMKNMPE